jgi:hypothetical protein
MEEQKKFAFEFARDTVHQFITLATGIIALTITFSKDFIGTVHPDVRVLAIVAWGLFLSSIFFGLWALMALTGTLVALTGTLEATRDLGTKLSIRGRNITIPASLQIVLFFLGLLFTIVFGIKVT